MNLKVSEKKDLIKKVQFKCIMGENNNGYTFILYRN